MIRLYHWANVAIEHIDLSRSKRGKDFGQENRHLSGLKNSRTGCGFRAYTATGTPLCTPTPLSPHAEHYDTRLR